MYPESFRQHVFAAAFSAQDARHIPGSLPFALASGRTLSHVPADMGDFAGHISGGVCAVLKKVLHKETSARKSDARTRWGSCPRRMRASRISAYSTRMLYSFIIP